MSEFCGAKTYLWSIKKELKDALTALFCHVSTGDDINLDWTSRTVH